MLQVAAWIDDQAQARLLSDTRDRFLHARFLSFFWGFADDFFVSLRWVAPAALCCAVVAGAQQLCVSLWWVARAALHCVQARAPALICSGLAVSGMRGTHTQRAPSSSLCGDRRTGV